MSKKNGTTPPTPQMTISKLFGRCLALHVEMPDGKAASFELKVMGDKATAGFAREQLLVALEMSGFTVVASDVVPNLKGDD